MNHSYSFVAVCWFSSYVSAKYPWIEAVHSFTTPFIEHATYNDQATIARFTIPAKKGPGDYMSVLQITQHINNAQSYQQ